MIFNFFSRKVNTTKQPNCPKCNRPEIEKRMSTFSISKGLTEADSGEMPDFDEAGLEKAMTVLAREAEGMDENDPRQAARLMKKLSEMTGLELGAEMEEAMRRLEAGEDPEKVEAEMESLFDSEDPLSPFSKKKLAPKLRPPAKDETLYDL